MHPDIYPSVLGSVSELDVFSVMYPLAEPVSDCGVLA